MPHDPEIRERDGLRIVTDEIRCLVNRAVDRGDVHALDVIGRVLVRLHEYTTAHADALRMDYKPGMHGISSRLRHTAGQNLRKATDLIRRRGLGVA